MKVSHSTEVFVSLILHLYSTTLGFFVVRLYPKDECTHVLGVQELSLFHQGRYYLLYLQSQRLILEEW